MTSERTSTTPTGRTRGSNGLAVAALVTGIAGILLALLFAVVGLALGVVAVASAPRHVATADGVARPRPGG
ncbi:hypothetical protein SAMN05660642_04258 [Geodermatophilus siccatus]|uniref:Uncharacterized protein n=1 Tax=Geodermatophilus siccatus TaxID=1137991 RepID=A0A1G9Z9N4_9ACTN|nr:DUF4190 domain-containing protein [Geodermatophilus siccatus]SDN18208.1 hypothetical protein SAMN05660642_04258 [Geodermatophilus siccatus]